MEYNHILIRYGEIGLKGKNRKMFIERLFKNIKVAIKAFPNVKPTMTRDRLFIELNGEDHEAIAIKLEKVFGIHSFSLAVKVESDIEEIKKAALSALQNVGKPVNTFKVSAKRPNKTFPVRSQEMNYEIGSYVLQNTENITVDVHNPDIDMKVEVRDAFTYITCGDYKGAGGLPVGVGGKVMVMLSGGIDSPVAAYLAMKRGVRVEAIHFHSPPFTSERAKQKVEDLTSVLTEYGGKIKLHVVHFTDIQKKIHKTMPANYSMTIMRRMMLRIAEELANANNAKAITTGESLGQVASQTLDSMYTINEVTNMPIIRPLITMDKVEIMDISRKIGTYDISIRPYEDCCTVFLPSAPKTKPKRENANRYEQSAEFEELIQEAVNSVETIVISNEKKIEDEQFEDLF
jgi:tRNA uracil 4-sulfurtransferase